MLEITHGLHENLDMIFDDCKIVIRDGMYAIARAKEFTGDLQFIPFALIYDGAEWTFILEENDLEFIEVDSVEKGWRILTFRMNLPFETVGFLSAISAALAQTGIPIFVISSYSTDHVLIKNKYISKAIQTLRGLGCKFQEG